MGGRRNRRGAVLIVVLAVLSVLALLGVTFNSIAQMDRSTARNYLDSVRAKMLARAGVEHVRSAIDGTDLIRDLTWVYSSAEPIEEAVQPSFCKLDASGKPVQILVNGKIRGYTDMVDTSETGAELFAVRVADCNALINVNDGVRFGNTHAVSRNLKRMLRVLATLRGVPHAVTDAIVDDRPSTGYRSKGEILARLKNDVVSFNRIKDFITVHAWEDPRVAQPVPLSPDVESFYDGGVGIRYTPTMYRFGRNVNARGALVKGTLEFFPSALPTDPDVRVYGLDELNPQWIEITSRAPINVNAATKEVLVAVLAGLKGFFLLEEPRSKPGVALQSPRTLGHLDLSFRRNGEDPIWTGDRLDYDNTASKDLSGRSDNDVTGLLYATEEIAAPTTVLAGGATSAFLPNSAVTIAEEIIACRKRGIGPSGFNYASAPFGGPFRSWAQFNLFCDNLVAIRALAETRSCFSDKAGGIGLDAQRRVAAQALADVLKANFNPNLHLNELNPDSSLATLVDKTDLIIRSTEFCFYPPGRFEIESLGQVLRPDSAGHTVLGESKILATVKLWDAYRETSQKQFVGGQLTGNGWGGLAATWGTNSGRVLEIGPEPDNGAGPSEADYAGYITFSTMGGTKLAKSPGALVRTPAGSRELGEWMHAHFQHDFDAHFHERGDNFRKECNRQKRGVISDEETASNHADRGDGLPGPYDPTWGGSALLPPRLARSFPSATGTTAPLLQAVTPMDLRIDGAYSERNSAPGYVAMDGVQFTQTRVTTTNSRREVFGSCPPTYVSSSSSSSSESGSRSGWEGFRDGRGAVSFWIKPAFRPETAGKIRSWFDFSRYHDVCAAHGSYKSPFGLWFLPMQGTQSGSFNDQRSLVFAASVPSDDRLAGFQIARTRFGQGVYAPTVNQRGTSAEDSRSTLFDAHRWTHVVLAWDIRNPVGGGTSQGARLFLNNREVGIAVPGTKLGDPYGTYNIFYHEKIDVQSSRESNTSTRYAYGYKYSGQFSTTVTKETTTVRGRYANTVRLGNPSQILESRDPMLHGDFPADATFDELYCFASADGGIYAARQQWQAGRYSPEALNAGLTWVSRPLDFQAGAAGRTLPAASSVTPPGHAAIATTGAGAAPAKPQVRVRGVSYTWYGEETVGMMTAAGPALKRVLWDYNASERPITGHAGMIFYGSKAPRPGRSLDVGLELVLLVDGMEARVGRDDAFSAMDFAYDPTKSQVKYGIRFVTTSGSTGGRPVLLAAPIFDDMTIYVSTGGSEFLEYTLQANA